MYHLTTSDRIDKIQREGLKGSAPTNLTIGGGIMNMDFYKEKGVYCLLEDHITNQFKSVTQHTIELDIDKSELVADIQSLVDKGCAFDESRDYLYFIHTPEILKPFEDECGINIEDLLTPEHPVCVAAIECTGSGVYPYDIPPEKIKSIYTHSQYQRAQYQGNCIDSFDDDGESLIRGVENVTDFAQVEESADRISLKDFLNVTKANINDLDVLAEKLEADSAKNIEYFYNDDRKIALAYNPEADVHGILTVEEAPQIEYKRKEAPSTKRRLKI